MIDARAKDAFWKVVEECLVQIHQLKPRTAHTKSAALRKRIEHPPEGLMDDLIYHAEPFDVACDLVGRQLDLRLYQSKYDSIASKHNW